MAGRFVVFEGIDGCGKQTQIAMLAQKLVAMDIKFALFKYPSEKSVKIKKYLEGQEEFAQGALLQLYSSDIQSEQPEIEAAVESGWAVADRYVISTAAYQGTDGNLDRAVAQLDRQMWISPDEVIWLDLPPEVAMERKKLQKTPDRHEKDLKFLKEVAANYGRLYESKWLTPRWHKIDAMGEKEGVFARICQALSL